MNPETDFFDFKIDPELSNKSQIDIVYSTDDEEYILQSVERIKKEISNTAEHVFSNKGHFTEPSLGQKECPEILEIILK